MSADRPASVLIATPCSARKRHRLSNEPSFDDLADAERRAAAFRRFAPLALPARSMYTGQHHQSVLRSVERLRRAWPDARVDLVIISAGLGLVDEHDQLIPYNATFAGLPFRTALARAHRLGIRPALCHRLAEFEASVLLLSEPYLSVLEPPLRAAPSEIYFAPTSLQLEGEGVWHIPAGLAESRALGVAPRMVRAALFERFVDVAVREDWCTALRSLQSHLQSSVRREQPVQLSLGMP